ncbi:MAG: sulfotransferase family 2 domain-containing protein [Cyanobacteriota bacterium]|nr:sulfotransferase family 2 domain-containing protein [Cyanobacteriota bacterium]
MAKDESKTIYFLHIRKTAGSSFFKKVKASERAPELRSFDGFQKYFAYFLQHPKTDLSHSIIRTHAYYGMHYFNLGHLFDSGKYTYVTILRDPIDRAISYYYYVIKERKAKYKHTDSILASAVDLKAFYQRPKRDNEQTRILSGRHSKFFDKCNPWLLDTAKKHLSNNFSVVGLTERFDETVSLFNQKFDWDLNPNVANAKVNLARPKQQQLSEEILNSLRESHKFDLELYDFAVKLFEKQLRG